MNTVYLVASGDLRLSANQNCWAAQEAMEKQVTAAVERQGWKVRRGHPYDPVLKHGFLELANDAALKYSGRSRQMRRSSSRKRCGSIRTMSCQG